MIDFLLYQPNKPTQQYANELKAQWESIDNTFVNRCNLLFEADAKFWPLQAILTSNPRCGYSIEKREFFLYVTSKNPMHYIMHETLHFYTHLIIREEISPALDVTERSFRDFNEALTVILNLEFSDLMGSTIDKGYPQHANIRNWIARERSDGASIREIASKWAGGVGPV